MRSLELFITVVIAIAAIFIYSWTYRSVAPLPPTASTRPKYYIPNQQQEKLEHVKEAFTRAGYELVTNMNYSEDWHTMWTFHNPFWQREPSVDLPAMMQTLKSHQKVNHVPGASRFTSKVELVKNAKDLAFIPTSFLLPDQYAEFQEFCQNSADKSSIWVKKARSHRGVKIIHPEDENLKSLEKDVIVQQFIRPYLIDKRLWDIGIYVAITSINPLRMYYFDNILVRACTDEFEEDLSKAKRDSYVVADDYLPPWGLPSLRPFYTWGMSTLNVVRAYFHSQGIEFDEIFKMMKHHVLELMISQVHGLKKSASKYPHEQKNFFSMYRVDFLLDRNLTPWITEINQSPNLSSANFPDLKTMFQRIAYSLLSLAGLAPGGMHHPDTKEQDLQILYHTNDIDIAYSLCQQCSENCTVSSQCGLCRRCRTPLQSTQLKELISEQRSRLGFIPLYPIRNHTIEFLGDALILGEDNHLQQWFVWNKCSQDYTWC